MNETIRKYFSRTLLIDIGDGPGQVPADRDLFEAGLVDSFAFVELVSFLEKEFKIKISDGEALSDELSSFAKMSLFVDAKVQRGGR
jgi:acyl carrier protein